MEHTLRRAIVVSSLSLFAAACGGGPKHIGEITPEVRDRLSGAWVLNDAESDDAQEVMEAARPAQGRTGGRPGGGMRPGGGRRGGMPGGGGGRGGMMPGGGRGGGGNPAAIRAAMRLVTVPPRHLEVALSDSLVTVGYSAADTWVLPFGEKVKREEADDVTVEARAEWENGRLVVRRSVSGAGSVTEVFMPSMDGKRLVVAVEPSVGARGGVEFRRVYDLEPSR